MLLASFSATASNFRGADQVYVPAAGKFGGASGTFISDVFISNLSNDQVDVSVVYVPLGNAPDPSTWREFKNAFRLGAGERREFVDFFKSGLNLDSGFGQLIFNACLAGADCSAATQDQNGYSVNFRDITVQTRIYSIPPGTTLAQNPPTTGQLFTGLPWYNFVSSLQSNNGLDRVFITGLRNTGSAGTAGTYRSNIGLVNASEFSNTTMVVKLYNGAGVQQGNEFTVNLGPFGNTQVRLDQAFPAAVGAAATNLWVTVEQRNSTPVAGAPQTCLPDGCPAFFTYGSILDNASGDATTLEPQYMKALSSDVVTQIYPTGAGKPAQRRSARH
ncbi:MAG TPA: hypothetical protein VF698_05755 [Thermoanaerobaculia bacterium]